MSESLLKETEIMKRTLLSIASLALSLFAYTSCVKCDDYEASPDMGDYKADGAAEGASGEEHGNSNAGMVTAGEWNDLDNWSFWSGLMLKQYEEFAQFNEYWGFYTVNRIAVKTVTEDGKPAAGAKIALYNGEEKIWSAVSDNLGCANCWVSLFDYNVLEDASSLRISINGTMQEGAPIVTSWSSEQVAYNSYTVNSSVTKKTADILFIVDATGSMSDEIDFLKSDLLDIVAKVEARQSGSDLRVGALFYRDEGDDYVTKSKDLTSDINSVSKYIGKQRAKGGGDYPEAVHTALEKGIQDISWNESARTKIAFMLLDAPAHKTEAVVKKLHQQVEAYAAAGIKLIPIAASGADKSTEFMLRYFAMATSGTYVFITNDSGIGEEHIEASVGDYEVEQLNALIVRLIDKYMD